jgi:hypothetical protein
MQKRQLASNLILFLFFILVSSAALFSNIFQTHTKSATEAIEQAKLFSSNELDLITRITLKNKSGEYSFSRSGNSKESPWNMVSPRAISSNSLFIEKLFTALTSINIKKLFPDEKINFSNFSIDKPTSTLNLVDQNGQTITIFFGLMNSIDNSTYLKVSGRSGIYHVEAPNVSLENASLANLIEAQIFAINLETVESLKIVNENKKNNIAVVEMKKTDGNWYNHENNLLADDKIKEYLQELSNLKSSFIIDKPTDAQKKQISTLPKEYRISIQDSQPSTVDYNISGLIKSLIDIDLKNEEYFVVSTTNNPTSYVVKKEFLELFTRKFELKK